MSGDRFEVPLYSIAEASRYLDVPRTTLQQWVKGYDARPKGRTRKSGAPIVTSVEPESGLTLPFVGLAEAYVLSAFRQARVPLQRIRPALDRLQEEFGIAHALASKSLYTDGAEVIFDYAERRGDTPEARSARDLVVVRNGQRVFKDVIESYLERIEFESDGWVKLIQLPQYDKAQVIVDPHRSFGAPIFRKGAARVEDVINRFKAGDALDVLSADFGIPQQELLDVLRVHVTAA
jgi:uncharacterized protein (DUF433 family)/transposase-like protein